MGNIGSEATKVNAAKYQIFVSSVSNEWSFLQDANLTLAHPEDPQPYTSGSLTYYSGAPRNRLTGTILYTSDMWSTATIGWTALMTKSNGEFPLFTLIVRETDKSGTSTNNVMTFTNSAKLESLSINKAVEGAVKATISIVMQTDPTIT